MKFISAYLRNLLIIALVIVGALIFAKIFYPGILPIFVLMGKSYSALKLWPIIILAVLIMAFPRGRKNRK